MARLPFVDTHVHFSDLQDPNLYYAWLQPGWKHPILGDIEGIQAQPSLLLFLAMAAQTVGVKNRTNLRFEEPSLFRGRLRPCWQRACRSALSESPDSKNDVRQRHKHT